MRNKKSRAWRKDVTYTKEDREKDREKDPYKYPEKKGGTECLAPLTHFIRNGAICNKLAKIGKEQCNGEDEVYCSWYSCTNCENTSISGDSNYCNICGIKIKWMQDGAEGRKLQFK